MKVIDEFLEFLLEHESDHRISFSKKMRYGYRYYYINFNIDEKPEEDTSQQIVYSQYSHGSTKSLSYRISDSIEIIIDNRKKE